jgi:predicted ATPase/DNA-binding XRE family transcriptional regulator
VETRAAYTFGDLLRRHRVAAGLTQEELAERANLSVRGLSDLERGLKQAPHRSTVQMLAEALELSEEDRRILEGAIPRRRGPVPTPEHSPPTVALPLPPTAFIGRKREVEEVRAMLLRNEVRLLTLTGPGGVGKTRLALRAAEYAVDHFPDGVTFVSLGSLADPALVPSTLAVVLGITESSGEPNVDWLIAHLGQKRALLVLDNFEHLLPAAHVLSRLLASCAEITMLVTSRAVLHLAAEHEYPVLPLATPTPGHLPGLSALAQYPAIQLFMQRARAVQPAFELTTKNARAIAEICCRLDGLPLALVLAAARIRLLPPQALLDRLADRLDLLTGGPRDVPARQQTLRETIDWSHSLLSPHEQTVFARLSVFAGGCSFEAAAAVCRVSARCACTATMLESLTSLVEQSLLQQTGESEPRFGMLETVREFAGEKLVERGEVEEMRRRHAQFVTELVETAGPSLEGTDQHMWLNRLETDHDNIRAALAWTLDGDPEAALRLAVGLGNFWQIRGHLSEGRRWIEESLAQMLRKGGEPDARLRGRALNASGFLALIQGDTNQARALLEQSLALSERRNDRDGIARSLNNLGVLATSLGEYDRARELLEQCLALHRELGNTHLVAACLYNLADVANHQGDYDQARARCQECLALYRERGDSSGIAATLRQLGTAAYQRGDHDEGQLLLEESLTLSAQVGDKHEIAYILLEIGREACHQGDSEQARETLAQSLSFFREVEDKRGIAVALGTLGKAMTDMGDLDEARTLLEESLALYRGIGDKRGIAASIAYFGPLEAARGRYEPAAKLMGAATRLWQGIASFPDAPDEERQKRALEATREGLTAEVFATAWAAGQAMQLEEALRMIRDDRSRQ